MEEKPKEEIKIVKIYTTYSDAQKRATKKYRENNKDKVNEQRKKYYINRKEKDPLFLEYKRQKAKEYYARQKALKEKQIKEQIDKVNKDVEKVLKSDKEVFDKVVEQTDLNKLITEAIEDKLTKIPIITEIEYPLMKNKLRKIRKKATTKKVLEIITDNNLNM